jgi:hypothetical protein
MVRCAKDIGNGCLGLCRIFFKTFFLVSPYSLSFYFSKKKDMFAFGTAKATPPPSPWFSPASGSLGVCRFPPFSPLCGLFTPATLLFYILYCTVCNCTVVMGLVIFFVFLLHTKYKRANIKVWSRVSLRAFFISQRHGGPSTATLLFDLTEGYLSPFSFTYFLGCSTE